MSLRGADVDAAIAAHEALPDPHTGYLRPVEVLAGTNVTVDTTTTPGSVIISGSGGGSPLADAAPPAVAGASAVGVSTDVAREDHTHAGAAVSHSHAAGDLPGLPTFIQDTQPTAGQIGTATKYMWWQTSGTALVTLWVETGP